MILSGLKAFFLRVIVVFGSVVLAVVSSLVCWGTFTGYAADGA